MGKQASSYYKGNKVMVSLRDKLREVAPTVPVSGGAHLKLVKHRESNQLLLAETFYYVALDNPPPEPVEDFFPPSIESDVVSSLDGSEED